ncbi:MAG: phosphatase PAP2 family protein [Acidimicrobiaceae bacterium]|jgi:membrane-associated phospholipid phosphatase|nr:phosphatase PAP2 family protein [Acidimicrobiaceae bacterium]MBK9970796.1 phosphatase PAP2 family protein [Acidimicrobiaceae bacterium]HQY84194.1 phosphatase PAP2 family protein [Ilumatobacteraceae bacterium]
MKVHEHKAVESFDAWADAQLERLRGNKAADVVFTTASELGDFSLIWHLVGAVRGLTSDHHANQAFIFSAFIGAESIIVNQGIKRLFRRTRPTEAGDPRYPVRKPSTSSFPSGHASSAFFAATLLTAWGGAVTAPAWFALAGVVGTSRAYVRIHHASDVVGGAVVGLALGQAALALLRAVN